MQGWMKYIFILFGFIVSVVLGQFYIKNIRGKIRKKLEEEENSHNSENGKWTADILGPLERSLYFVSILFGYPAFIGVWIAAKFISQSGEWGGINNQSQGKNQTLQRSKYNHWLIGNALAIAWGTIPALAVEVALNCKKGMFSGLLIIVVFLILNLFFWLFVDQKTKDGESS